MVHTGAVKTLHPRVPFLRLDKPEHVFDLQLPSVALLVDLEGTLTEFSPSPRSVIEAMKYFDEVAARNGVDLKYLHYVTNADLKEGGARWPAMPARLHFNARKPFFNPPSEFLKHGQTTIVLGDQYFTDGLLAWRFGFSFALVSAMGQRPLWPRIQLFIGHMLARLFFKVVKYGNIR